MRNSRIKVSTLALMTFLLSFAIMYTYGRGITVIYGVIELTIAVFCYFGFFRWFRKIDKNLGMLCLFIVTFAWISGIFNGDLKSTLLITVPLIIPVYVSTFNIEYKSSSDFMLVTVVAVIITFLAIMRNAFGDFNSNTLGFMGFMGVSFGFIWIKNARFKIIPIGCVLFGMLCANMSGSRNVALLSIACVIMLLLPESIFCNRMVYFTITIAILIYTIFSTDIMAWGFSVPKINDFLLNFTSRYSQKAWEMASRVDYLRMVQESISQRNILLQIFGTGTLTMHGHNMFYQCVLEFGYFGTMLIYIMFFRIFKLAYILIRENQDNVARGCVIALWGNLLLQAADVYLLGPETYAVVPQVLMGIILQRYAVYRKELVYACQKRENLPNIATF